MTGSRQMVGIVRACFCTLSPQTLVGVSYAGYLVWLELAGIEGGGGTIDIHMCIAPAIAGMWIGSCVSTVAAWPGTRFTPAFVTKFSIVAALAAVSALALTGLLGWIGGLDPRPFAALGTLTMIAGIASGCTWPSFTMYLFVGAAILLPFASPSGSAVPLPPIGSVGAAGATIVLAATTVLLVRIALRLRVTRVISLSTSTPRRPDKLLRNRLWEPSMPRVAVWSGALAAGCTFAHRLPTSEWRDIPLIVVIGSLFANLTATGTSLALPRGPLPGTARLLLSGIAHSRADAGRRMLWRIVADSAFAAGVFTAVAIALGPDWHLVEMMLVALAACHAYLATACGSRWLMSSRLSVLVATPVVVAIAGVVWVSGPWGLPAAIAAFVLSAVAAVYVGALGMARVDLDLAPYPELAR